MSTITIVISAYNYARFLPRCLKSILNQTRKPDEIIVIDDYSSDNTNQIIKIYLKKIIYLRHKKRVGNLKTYNEGIKLAKGDYLILFNADDFLNKSFLEKAADLLDKNPKVALVYSQSITLENNQQKLIIHKVAGRKSYIGRKEDFYLLLTQGNFISGNTVLVRRKVYKKLGGFNTSLPSTADHEMWIRIARNYPLAYIAKPLSFYRIHGKNIHLQDKNYYLRMEHEYGYIFNKYVKTNKSMHKSIRNLIYYKYYISIANNCALSNDLLRTVKFWWKALSQMPLSIYYWSSWQPFYFFMKNFIFS